MWAACVGGLWAAVGVGVGVGCWCGVLAWDSQVEAWRSTFMCSSIFQSMFIFTGGGPEEGINSLL